MTGSLSRRCAPELVGTALLIVFGAGSVVAALTVGKSLDYAALSVVGLSFGLVVAIVIYAFGTTPTAHINPAVIVSLAGSSSAVSSGVCSSSGLSARWRSTAAMWAGWPSPLAWTTRKPSWSRLWRLSADAGDYGYRCGPPRPRLLGWARHRAVGDVPVVVFGPLTGAAVNPARALNPNAVASLFGGSVAWTQFPAYVVGSMLGGIAAALSQDLIAARETPRRWTSRPRAPKVTWSDPASDRAQAARNRTGGTSRKR